MKSKQIAQGAEAKIILNKNLIIKNRISKSYRIKELDNKIRKSRTKAETKLMLKASKLINVPLPLTTNSLGGSPGKDGGVKFQIKMPFIDGKKLSDHLDKLKNKLQVCKQIGKDIAKLHNDSIIHGDLTTSNMILTNKTVNKKTSKKTVNVNLTSSGRTAGELDGGANSNTPTIFFIDFGLGYISHKVEDKAVDLHLLRQALEAKHFKHYNQLWKAVEQGYKTSKDSKKVFERLKAVEKRGRYKK